MKEKTKAILYILCAGFCFAWMSAFVRLAGDLPSVEKSFFRNLVAAFAALALLKRSGEGIHLKKENLHLFLLRSLCGTVGVLGNFYAVDHLVLSNASMLNKMSPFFALLFSFLLLREKLSPVQLALVCTAFAGSLFIIKPTVANLDLMPSLAGLAGGIGAGAAYTFVRMLGLRGEKGAVIVLFFSTFSCLSLLPWVATHFVPMSTGQLLCLLGAGAAATGGQFSITAAYTHAPAREVSIYDYSQILFAAAIGFLLFGDIPDGWSFLGYVLIIGAAFAMFWYNNRGAAANPARSSNP